ncbi:MAG: peptidylprolyl isomerase [Glaciihabitans sp.]|nr:peptidylprolyl isomerase [Glaciihabitans sp.]
MKEGAVRKSVAVIVAACFVAVTAGCTAIPDPSSCDPILNTGAASKLVSATGDAGKMPTVSFPTPITTTTLQTTQLSAGDGDTLYPGSVANVQASIYVGSTGELLTATAYDPTAAPLLVTVGKSEAVSAAGTIAASVQCQTVGSRTATVGTVAEFFGADALDPSYGLTNDDALVLVTDVEASYLGRANGALQPLKSGFPAVVTAPNGTPGITLPNENPPTDLEIEVIRKGDGATVKKDDSVVLNYTGVLWNSDGAAGTVFQSTWTDAATPQAVVLAATAMGDDGTSGLVPGFAKALVGQTVGSQVLVVVPPKFGYPEGSSPTDIPEGSTMVFVFDVLGIQ